MRFLQFGNENIGLSFYDEKKEVTSGLSGLDFAGLFDDTAFKAVSTTLYTYIFQNVTGFKRATITASPSYVPDMLRLYMSMVGRDRKAYNPKDYDKYWLAEFTMKGFDPEITKLFFKRFYEMNNDGLVPRNIWFPNPKTVSSGVGTPTYTSIEKKQGLSTGAIVGIGAGVAAGLGALYLALK